MAVFRFIPAKAIRMFYSLNLLIQAVLYILLPLCVLCVSFALWKKHGFKAPIWAILMFIVWLAYGFVAEKAASAPGAMERAGVSFFDIILEYPALWMCIQNGTRLLYISSFLLLIIVLIAECLELNGGGKGEKILEAICRWNRKLPLGALALLFYGISLFTPLAVIYG